MEIKGLIEFCFT